METENMDAETNASYSFSLMGLLIALRAARVRLDTDAAGLQVNAPAGALTPLLRDAIRRHKEALESLPLPFLSAVNELIVPAYAPPQYHWQPVAETLQELCAPPQVWQQFRRERPAKT